MNWIRHVLSLELRKAISYRADFWVQFLGTLATEVVVAYFLWRAIYATSGQAVIGGYTFSAMMTYYVLMQLISRVVRGTDIGFISPEIYDGSLTRYLVYPMSFFGYKYLSYLAQSLIAVVQLVVMVVFFRVVVQRVTGLAFAAEVTVPSLVLGILSALAAASLYFALMTVVEMIAFWNDAIWTLLVIMRFSAQLLGGGLIPLSLFPKSAQDALAYSPFPYMLSFPARVLMGDIEPAFVCTGIMACAVWGAVFLTVAHLLWRRGSYQYSSVGI
jgi:ABC-2 type transport system permease protein